MKRVVWLLSLHNRLSHSRRRLQSGQRLPEQLEQRNYLSAASALIGSELQVFANHDEAITVRPDPAGSGQVQVLIDGMLDKSVPPTQASQLSSIRVSGGSGDNRIDLSAVSSVDFAYVSPVTGLPIKVFVDGGDGNDTIIGTADLNDTLRGGDGNDVFNDPLIQPLGTLTIDAGDGNDSVYGGMQSDTIDGGDGNDLILANAGDDVIVAGDGNDFVSGAAGNDSISGGDGRDSIVGGIGDDTLSGDAGRDTVEGDDGDDLISGGSEADEINGDTTGVSGNDTITGDAGDDSVAGGGGNDVIDGGNGRDLLGADVLGSASRTLSVGDVTVQEGDNTGVFAVFSVSISSASPLPVTVDISTMDDTAKAGQDYVAKTQTLTFQPGMTTQTFAVTVIGDLSPEITERFFVVLSNPIGVAVADPSGIGTITDGTDGPTQVVFLDFDSATDLGDHVYTQVERDAIQARMEDDYAEFHTVFTQTAPLFGAFSTIIINQPPPGGLAQEVDFRNVNRGLSASVDINGFLGNVGDPPATTQNFIELTAKVAAHELGHLMGLRHGDAYGPIGSGINAIPGSFAYFPNYPGPSNASESNRHIMGSPASTGESLFDAVSNQYFGAREAVRLSMFAYQGQVLTEQTAPHSTVLSAQSITLASLAVPNTDQSGALAGKVFDVTATSVTGSLSAPGEADFYSFTATAGQLLNVEVMSQLFIGSPQPRITDPIDSVVSIVDASGNPINYYGSTATNDDEFETTDSILIDLVIPADGTYYIRISDLAVDTGGYELFAWTFAANDPTPEPGVITVGQPITGQITLIGGNGNDTLIGTDQDDLLIGQGGDDSIIAEGGNDVVYGSGGRDSIDGGDGNDSLYGQGGIDTLIGDAGDDFIDGGTSRDRIFGDDLAGLTTGNDTLVGGAGNDSIFAGAGDDFLLGGGGNDTLQGEAGSDTLSGQAGRDVVSGGDDDDSILWKRDGSDTVDGGAGLDTVEVRGTAGADVFSIGSSGTTLTVTSGSSVLNLTNADGALGNPIEQLQISAGSGADTVTINSVNTVGTFFLVVNGDDGNDFINGEGALTGSTLVVFDGGNGDDTIRGTIGDDSILGGNGQDSLRGGAGNDIIQGQAGQDTLDGMLGDDSLDGGDQNDSLLGGLGDDTLDGGLGDDSLDGDDGNDLLRGSFGRDMMLGDAGNDSLYGGANEDNLTGGGGNDYLNGGANDDTISGNSGADRISGDQGNDLISGGDGDDTVDAGDGNDTVYAGDGNDGITAGDGNDVVLGEQGRDTVLGGDGNDTLIGGADNDILLGQLGDDVLTGNGGADTFDAGEGNNAISDVAVVDTVFTTANAFPITVDLLNKLAVNA